MEAAPPYRSATWLGKPTTTWQQTDFSKSMELTHSSINTPTVEMRGHTHHILEIPLAKLPFLV
jgi:hypothetical protein